MEAINISRKYLRELQSLRLSNVSSGEGSILRNPLNGKEVLKILHQQNGLYLSNKLYTLNSLYDIEDALDNDSFVLPNRLLTVDDKVVGFTMPLINGVTLADILFNADIDIKIKKIPIEIYVQLV